MKNKITRAQKSEFPKVLETFFKPSFWRHEEGNPSVFNGIVNIVKYRITVEIIEEPTEIIHARLEDLWRKSDNYHHHGPLQEAAKIHNYLFTGAFGSNRPKK